MIAFHPTISLKTFVHGLKTPAHDFENRIGALFPAHSTILTDSGRSALALIVEACGLQNKRIAVPAFLCNVLLPIFKKYQITPVFLDIDDRTYQPPESAYSKDVLAQIDAALLVATYGRPIEDNITAMLKNAGKIVIEDYAHVPLPAHPVKNIAGDARYYSLPKSLPVPDGGLAILPPQKYIHRVLPPHAPTLTFVKNWLKLFRFQNAVLFRLKFLLHIGTSPAVLSPSLFWRGVRQPSKTAKRILCSVPLNQKAGGFSSGRWRYCYPLRTADPRSAQEKLFTHGIIAERIWFDPIIFHKDANADAAQFPHTRKAAAEVLCLPLWHVKTAEDKRRYEKELKEILPGEFRGFGE